MVILPPIYKVDPFIVVIELLEKLPVTVIVVAKVIRRLVVAEKFPPQENVPGPFKVKTQAMEKFPVQTRFEDNVMMAVPPVELAMTFHETPEIFNVKVPVPRTNVDPVVIMFPDVYVSVLPLAPQETAVPIVIVLLPARKIKSQLIPYPPIYPVHVAPEVAPVIVIDCVPAIAPEPVVVRFFVTITLLDAKAKEVEFVVQDNV